jgi:hypothetical protein
VSVPNLPRFPTTPLPGSDRVSGWVRAGAFLGWLVLALPALYQIGLLAEAIAGRVGYPYDLEWMEGGMLHHALRIRLGEGIYAAPSVDFIPYLYTPLYPTLLALFGGPFGVSYALGRAISIAGLVGIAIAAIASLLGEPPRRPAAAWTGIALALGLFAAFYPFVEGWYDLVRADTFFLFMVTAGIAGLPSWSKSDDGVAGHGKVAAGAALMALAFFCKQTGIFYVAFGGLIVLAVNWRRAPIYAVMAGVIGLGGVWLLNRSTDGWFWTYVSEIHRAHDFNWDRFYRSFGTILWHFPALVIVIATTVTVVTVTASRTGEIPAAARPFGLWTAAFLLSTVVGAIGWGTEFAHFNAYMPAFLHGSLAAGAAIPAMLACVQLLARDRRRARAIATACAMLTALPLAITCLTARWRPADFMPTDGDVAAGDRLIHRLAAIDGDVWMPSHPWYLVLAGKTPHVHRMGIKDVTTRQTRTVVGLDAKLHHHGFAAVVLDNRDLHTEIDLRRDYRPAFVLPPDERPRLYTGAKIVPDSIWIPAISPAATPPAKVVFDFESPRWPAGWRFTGTAWGDGPVSDPLPGQGIVFGASGARFATSMHGGDPATGYATSPKFLLDGGRLTIRLGGGTNASTLRVELWVDAPGDPNAKSARTAIVPTPAGDGLRTVTIELGELRGKLGMLVLVDEAPDAHLNVDDVWLWP